MPRLRSFVHARRLRVTVRFYVLLLLVGEVDERDGLATGTSWIIASAASAASGGDGSPAAAAVTHTIDAMHPDGESSSGGVDEKANDRVARRLREARGAGASLRRGLLIETTHRAPRVGGARPAVEPIRRELMADEAHEDRVKDARGIPPATIGGRPMRLGIARSIVPSESVALELWRPRKRTRAMKRPRDQHHTHRDQRTHTHPARLSTRRHRRRRHLHRQLAQPPNTLNSSLSRGDLDDATGLLDDLPRDRFVELITTVTSHAALARGLDDATAWLLTRHPERGVSYEPMAVRTLSHVAAW